MKYATIATCVLVACAGMAKADFQDRFIIPHWKPVVTKAVVRTIWEAPATPPAKPVALRPEKPKRLTPILHPERRYLAVLPPEKYDHPYTMGEVEVRIVNSQAEVRKACPYGKFGEYAIGCSMHYGSLCVIILANDDIIRSEGFTTEIVKRHEIGHCNFWPGHHPDSRFLTSRDWAEK